MANTSANKNMGNDIQIETIEEGGLLDTSRANDFDGSFLKVAEFESEHLQVNNS